MSLRYRRYSNLKGHQVEFASELVLPYPRYFRRESKSQKTQIHSQSKPDTTKGKTRQFHDKI